MTEEKEKKEETVWNYLSVKSDSGNIASGAHDGKNTARIKFKNGLYEYPDFPLSDWEKFSATFQTTDSTGAYFSKNLRQFKFKKL